LKQHVELLAHHWELSDTPERSISYLVLAGEKSNQCMAASAAADFFTRALSQIERTGKPPDPGLVLRIRIGRADPLQSMGKIEESFGDYQEAIRLAKEMGDEQTALNCLTGIPTLIYNTRLNSQVPQFCEEGLGLARALGDKGAEAGSMVNFAFWRHVWHGTDDFEALYRALALAQESGQPRAIFVVRLMLALFERSRGDPRRSLEYSEGLIEMLQSAFNIFAASTLSFVRGWSLTEAGRYQEAITFLSHWKEIMERNAIYINLGRCCNSLGWAYAEVYALEEARSLNQQASELIAALQRSPSHFLQASEMQAMTEVNLMENEFDMGKTDEAWQHFTSFEQTSAHPDYDLRRDRWTLRMMDLKGRILLRRGDLEGANQVAQRCLEVATERQYKKYVGKAERLLGQIATEKGAHDLAKVKLGTALSKFEEVGNPKQLWITHSALAWLYQMMSDTDEERNQWEAAAALVRSTADGLKDGELRSTFLDAAPIREIVKKANSTAGPSR
jgi:tetratricopeptide (TPR) repeat protein